MPAKGDAPPKPKRADAAGARPTDPRFARVGTDPRFARFPQAKDAVVVDDRFKGKK